MWQKCGICKCKKMQSAGKMLNATVPCTDVCIYFSYYKEKERLLVLHQKLNSTERCSLFCSCPLLPLPGSLLLGKDVKSHLIFPTSLSLFSGLQHRVFVSLRIPLDRQLPVRSRQAPAPSSSYEEAECDYEPFIQVRQSVFFWFLILAK